MQVMELVVEKRPEAPTIWALPESFRAENELVSQSLYRKFSDEVQKCPPAVLT